MSGNDTPAPRPHDERTGDGRRRREILSYARRSDRMTSGQAAAWTAHHRAWVIPDRALEEPGFDLDAWFGRGADERDGLVVEIGSGIGEATVALASQRPSWDVLAFEVWRPGMAATLRRLADAGVENVRLCGVDAAWAFRHVLGADSIAELWTFFPDPWRKTRHHKRRLVGPGFAEVAATRLEPGGVWRLATDWADYVDHMVRVLDAVPGLSGGVVERWEDRPVTKFERRGVAAGRTIVDLAYRRVT